MTCTFCGSRHQDGETRCRLCGRKSTDTLTGEFSLIGTQGALATQARVAPEPAIDATKSPRPLGRAVQRVLFPDRDSKIVPFDVYAPEPPKTRPSKPRAASKPRTPGEPRTTRRKVINELQTELDFLPPEPVKPRTLSTTVEAVILSDAPVATPFHRLVAGALDGAMVLVAYGIFLIAFFTLGGEFTWNQTNLISFASALALIGVAYGTLWTLAGIDSAGMRWAGLRLSTFDGFPLERKRRALRLFGGCLSLATLVGQLWCLADEECLNWQDHISGTYPTPCQETSQVFRRL